MKMFKTIKYQNNYEEILEFLIYNCFGIEIKKIKNKVYIKDIELKNGYILMIYKGERTLFIISEDFWKIKPVTHIEPYRSFVISTKYRFLNGKKKENENIFLTGGII